MTAATDLRPQALTRAAEDGDFRARLIAGPKAGIASEVGATVPDGELKSASGGIAMSRVVAPSPSVHSVSRP